jgi:hypothetical protein
MERLHNFAATPLNALAFCININAFMGFLGVNQPQCAHAFLYLFYGEFYARYP